jgi:hypothetical protein
LRQLVWCRNHQFRCYGGTFSSTPTNHFGESRLRRRVVEFHLVAELGELGYEPVAAAVGVVAVGDVVRPAVVVGLAVGGHDDNRRR